MSRTDAIEVTPVPLARVTLPDTHPEGPGADTVHGFLVRAGAHCVLVDTGVGTGSDLIEGLYRPERVEVPAALAAAGVSLDRVTAVVNSHLHFDHCGNNPLFPGIPIFVQQAELEAARQPHYTVREWIDFPGARYVPVHGRHRLAPGLELQPTPGHTPGHQSLVVRSEGRVEIIVAQAAYSASEFQRFCDAKPGDPSLEPCLRSNAAWSAEAYVASLAALRRLRPQRAFFSHDGAAWARDGRAGRSDPR
ncbi:MAG TPA: N-acyl homoserine lactonase family protein [Myxococcota bacterium]|nr:N-acyl homoserine lactonase family protein [Myxococcota bacterium]